MKPSPALWPLLAVMSLILGLSAWPALAVPPNPNPTLPTGFTANLYVTDNPAIEPTDAERLSAGPTALAFAPDGRLFIAERTGNVRVATGELTLQATPFHTLTTVTDPPPDERGLIGLTLDPNFASNGFVYVNYTVINAGRFYNRISRLRANPSTSNVSDGTETILFEMSDLNPAEVFHVGGAIRFGGDGRLYIATGENNTETNSQDMTVTHGKILRINADGSIPTSNPFYGSTTGINRAIWALGVRNAFQINFHPTSGLFFLNDVGESTWEEINVGTAGANYGWPNYDGSDLRPPYPVIPGMQGALYQYNHGYNGFSCAVTGGVFYSGAALQYPNLYSNDYFFGDYCGGWIEHYDVATNTNTPFLSGFGFGMVGMATSPGGELYVLRQTGGGSTGTVVRISYNGLRITQNPANISVVENGSASFTCAAAGGTAPITYQWQRGGVAIPGATSATYTLSPVTLADDGADFSCIATDAASQTDTSTSALLTVTAALVPTPTVPAGSNNGQNAAQINVADPSLSKVGVLLPGELRLVGERLQWDITVSNSGTASAFNVVITDTLRSELRIESVNTPRGTAFTSSQTVSVTFNEVAAGETITFSIVTTVLASNITVDNTACLTSDGLEQRCVTAAPVTAGIIITQLPSTGETPVWRAPLLVLLGLLLSLGIVVGWRK